MKRAKNGKESVDMTPENNKSDRSQPLELHHADNMLGSTIHEVGLNHSSNIWHQTNNQGVVPQMRSLNSKLHWQLRVQEMGNKPPK
ncbi:hypothetical protein MM213_19535 [Belliella sp. R4-6]|uniref:Uncharacterized protein n=1 Tax=Belliella alkalica TaxID=1730871 RepID=A0ABS9VGY3_9BACT|nr:hypothetical protein [Belliella alkalica]MCH7415702.1 hypothetical protein [Belliella alkalica]